LRNYDNNIKNLRGFTYLGILFVVAFIGIGLAAAGTFWSVTAQRSAEKQLLFVGHSIRNAIRSYYLHGTAGVHQYPRSLEELIQDNRTGILQRHLRKIPIDPMTNSKVWNLITLADGGIIGVSSMSQKRPIKRGNFSLADEGLTDAECYCDWRFVYLPQLQGQ
jgi:type II secretory pathway pseudopilin PulG